jgi:hypothetical protein
MRILMPVSKTNSRCGGFVMSIDAIQDALAVRVEGVKLRRPEISRSVSFEI